MDPKIAADLRPSADGSTVRTSLVDLRPSADGSAVRTSLVAGLAVAVLNMLNVIRDEAAHACTRSI